MERSVILLFTIAAQPQRVKPRIFSGIAPLGIILQRTVRAACEAAFAKGDARAFHSIAPRERPMNTGYAHWQWISKRNVV